MRNSIANPKPRYGRRALAPLLCGVVLLACCIGGSHSASAFGFGRMGGFGRPMMGGPIWRRPPPPRGGRFVGPPPPGRRGWPTRHPPIVGGGGAVGGGIVGGGIVGGAAARAAGGGNNGGGAAAAQGNSPFVPDEIVTSFAPGTTPQAIAQFAQRSNLAQLESQSFPLIGTSLYRWRIGGGRSVASVVQALGAENIVATVQPNYLFALQTASRSCRSRRRGRCRSICPGRAANRAGASDRDRKIHHGRCDRLRDRRKTSRPRRRRREKL